ncbi:MAG: hypothetical protein APR54_10690 [Candidatus Cloacimonas sp. SDB]|nr:MAG: hypothetical protein APR54_10690 [Candidatus Cloacimonas sp. SDB]
MKNISLLFLVVLVLLSCGESTTSPKPAIEQPTGLNAVLVSSTEIQLIWLDNSATETGFIIERKKTGENYLTIATVEADITNFSDNYLEPNTEYTYRVAAYRNGDQSDWDYSNSVLTPLDILAPSNLKFDYLSNERIDISWTDNTDNESGFRVQRKTGTAEFTELVFLTADIEEYSDLDIDPITIYAYRVSAQLEEGQTDWSNEIEVITPPELGEIEFGMDETLEIMTWNVQNFPKNDLITVSYMVEIIQNLDIDIIALQEIESYSYFTELLDYLEGWDGYKANSASYNIDLAYIYKVGVIEVENIYEIYTDDWYAFPRSPLVMEFSYNNESLVVINNHFKASGGTENEYRRRQASLKLEEYISENLDDVKVIVAGDLNDEIQEPEEDNVFWNFIEQPELYQFADMEIALGTHYNWSYPTWPSHLDHILITNELFNEFEAALSAVQTLKIDDYLINGWSEYDNNVSDHRPVALRISVGE